MRRSSLLRRASVVVASAAAAVLVGAGTASAAPAPGPADAVAELQALAAAHSPAAVEAASALADSLLVPQDILVTLPETFLYPAPTLGCGVGDLPITFTIATAQPGFNLAPFLIQQGELRFQALPLDIAIPSGSDLTVLWINLSTFQVGSAALDDTALGVPTFSKTVETGEGPVLAALFGGTSYLGGGECFVLPTVGIFEA
ncbi:hypothetical protein G4H71_21560 [Rhodococcus triatomae]|uniref:Uncharacterized protein n=1 Tax=Rhodococcus triatomae TaxID=300028 RepID=A0A1G8NY87_9NOCA|nr:hypothetical protein [Rhodococcus triatomae]QNG18799.1 hypothetical protein G4H72_08815 [Rhodococcus triatomae]QNG25290.1 hypothetical protein G4H71_21560 [Rhodococcus triatomae]SDI85251.1 hypothetical protein SAMN05444695_1126 [Rhodococcus triatomae]